MKKLYKLIQEFTPKPDKLGHFYWGFIYSLFGFGGFLLFDTIWLIALPSIVLAASKEFFDKKGYGNAELLDFVFTVIPSVVFTLIIYILQQF